MAGQLSRKSVLFPLLVLLAAVCMAPLFVGGYMPSSTATSTSVTSSAGTITLGDTVTFTATVTATTGTATGLVTFFDGNTPIGNGTLNQGSPDQATFSTSLLSAAGSPHSITATYQGDATHTSSTSSATSETVNERTSTTGVVLNPATVVVGQSSTATVTVTDSGSVPPGTADTFTTTGAPATGRTGFTSTLFADGLVLVVGGTDANNNVLNTAEIYSVSNKTFSSTGNLNTARTGAVAVLLPTGKVLVAGGSSDGTANGALNSAELFDPSAGTFTTTSNTMTAARFGATATLLNTGKVLIAGGENSGGVLNSAELYDPIADTFTATGNLTAVRTGHSATLLGTGKVLVAGGSNDGTANGALNTAELFDPAGNSGAGTFTAITGANSTLAVGRWQPEGALLLSGKVLIAGGQNSGGALASADLYDPVANTFTPSNSSMAQARANGSAVALPNGMVLLAGGTTSQAVDLYDADSDRFDTTGSLQQSDTGLISTLLNNGDVLVVGLTTAATPASDAELYAPSFNPLGTVAVTSSEATDSITGTCTLTPSTSTASTCTSTVTPGNVATSPHTITGTYPADAVHSTSNNTASLTVNKADTTTTVTSSVNPSVFGQSVTFTATVSAVAPGSGTPTGTVTFLDGGSPIGTGTLSGGIATFTTSALTVGNHTITTSYGGDSNFNGSTGALTGDPQVVNKADTSTTVTSSVNPSVFGQSVTFTATVSAVAPGSGTPAGTVTFLDGGSPIGTGTLSGGIATFTTSALTVGNHTITTSYGGDGNFNGSTGSLTGNPQVVNKADTSTTVTSSVNPSVFGQSVTFTATVSAVAPGSGTPAGTVTFLDGGSPIGTGTLSGGIATFTTSALAVGNHTITTSYGGDSNFNGSTGSLTGNPQVVNKADTSTTVTSSVNPSVFGQSVTFTATVSAVAPGSGTPTGTVTFLDGGSPIGTGTLSGGIATFTTSGLAVGNHTITTSYGGDGNFNGNTGSLTGNPQVVNKADTSTTVTSSVNPSVFGQPVTFTATVSAVAPGVGTPTGTVTFLDGGSPIGTGTLSGGIATFTTSALAVGNHTITTSYGGDGNFNGSTGSLTGNPQVVNKDNTTTTITANTPNPSKVNQAVTISATVTANAPGAGTPSGSVQVSDGVGELCTITLSSGSGSCSLTPQAAGTDTLTAIYSGDGNFNGSSSPGVLQTVNTRHTTTTVSFTPSTVVVNQQTTVTITVTDDDPNGTAESPMGLISVTSDSGGDGNADTIVGSPCTLSSGATGVSSCQVTLRPHGKGSGTHTVTASFTKTTVHSASTGSGMLTVNTRHTHAAVVLGPASVVVNQTSTATVTVTDDDPDSADALSPTGTVAVTSDSGGDASTDVILGTCSLSASAAGASTCQVTVTPKGKGSGTHNLTALYPTSDVHTTSTSPGTPLTVGTRHTSTKVGFSISPVKIATQLTVTATVTDDDPNGSPLPPAGTLNLSSSEGTDSLSSPHCTLSGSGASTTCTINLTAPHVAGGSHTITASFTQDDQHSSSNTVPANSVLAVQPAKTATVIPSATGLHPAPTFNGQQLTFTSVVSNSDSATGSTAAPVGTLQFLVDSNPTPIGTATVSPSGSTSSSATFTANLAQIGPIPGAGSSPAAHSVSAVFVPNADFITSPSTDSIDVTLAPALTNIPGQTIPPVTFPINSTGTTGNITFQCTVLLLSATAPTPNSPICALTPGNNSVTVTLTTTSSPSSMVSPGSSLMARNRPGAGFYALSTPLAGILGLLLVGGARRKHWSRRKLLGLLGMMVLLSVLLIAMGCGGGFNNPSNLQPLGNGTAQGQYVISVVGTDSGGRVVTVATMELTVQL